MQNAMKTEGETKGGQTQEGEMDIPTIKDAPRHQSPPFSDQADHCGPVQHGLRSHTCATLEKVNRETTALSQGDTVLPYHRQKCCCENTRGKNVS